MLKAARDCSGCSGSLPHQPVCVRCEEAAEAEEPVYQGILEVKRVEEEELRSLKVSSQQLRIKKYFSVI
jgi:hypothetical protein